MEEYGRYVSKEREDLQSLLPRGVKGWWIKARRLMQKRGATSSIPALRDDSGKWFLDAESKANLSAATSSRKYKRNAKRTHTPTSKQHPTDRKGDWGRFWRQTLRRCCAVCELIAVLALTRFLLGFSNSALLNLPSQCSYLPSAALKLERGQKYGFFTGWPAVKKECLQPSQLPWNASNCPAFKGS